MSNIIEIKNITKEFKVLNRREGLKGSLQDLFSRDYKIVRAVDNISMNIQQGEIVGYLGPNGAGKSTTIKMMTGILEPTSGEILVGGNVPYQNRTKNAQEIGVVFGQRSQLWWALPLVESFKILKDIYGVSDADYEAMLTLYKSLVDIEPLLHKPVRQMSLGQRTLSDILAAFLHNPKIVFLDEPTIGLDPKQIIEVRNLIRTLVQILRITIGQKCGKTIGQFLLRGITVYRRHSRYGHGTAFKLCVNIRHSSNSVLIGKISFRLSRLQTFYHIRCGNGKNCFSIHKVLNNRIIGYRIRFNEEKLI